MSQAETGSADLVAIPTPPPIPIIIAGAVSPPATEKRAAEQSTPQVRKSVNLHLQSPAPTTPPTLAASPPSKPRGSSSMAGVTATLMAVRRLSRSRKKSSSSVGASTGEEEPMVLSPSASRRSIGFSRHQTAVQTKERQKRIADRSKARYQRLLAEAQKKAAAVNILHWWRETSQVRQSVDQRRREVRLRALLNRFFLRCVVSFKRRLKEKKERMAAAKALLAAQGVSVVVLQRWWRQQLAVLHRLRARMVKIQMLTLIHLHDRATFAATKIQAVWRAYSVARAYRLQLSAVHRRREVLVVNVVRSHVYRKVAAERNQERIRLENEASTTIARAYSHYRQRMLQRQQRFLHSSGLSTVPDSCLR